MPHLDKVCFSYSGWNLPPQTQWVCPEKEFPLVALWLEPTDEKRFNTNIIANINYQLQEFSTREEEVEAGSHPVGWYHLLLALPDSNYRQMSGEEEWLRSGATLITNYKLDPQSGSIIIPVNVSAYPLGWGKGKAWKSGWKDQVTLSNV